jgi:bacterioferritin-associated ferredoxin
MDEFCTQDQCDDCSQRFVCRCLQITETALIETLTTRDISSLKDLRRHAGAGDGCTACHRLLQKYLDAYGYSSASPICSVK